MEIGRSLPISNVKGQRVQFLWPLKQFGDGSLWASYNRSHVDWVAIHLERRSPLYFKVKGNGQGHWAFNKEFLRFNPCGHSFFELDIAKLCDLDSIKILYDILILGILQNSTCQYVKQCLKVIIKGYVM